MKRFKKKFFLYTQDIFRSLKTLTLLYSVEFYFSFVHPRTDSFSLSLSVVHMQTTTQLNFFFCKYCGCWKMCCQTKVPFDYGNLIFSSAAVRCAFTLIISHLQCPFLSRTHTLGSNYFHVMHCHK